MASQEVPNIPEPTYEVEAILGAKGPRRARQYLVQWKGYPIEESSWEPRSMFETPQLIDEYEARLQAQGIRNRSDLAIRADELLKGAEGD